MKRVCTEFMNSQRVSELPKKQSSEGKLPKYPGNYARQPLTMPVNQLHQQYTPSRINDSDHDKVRATDKAGVKKANYTLLVVVWFCNFMPFGNKQPIFNIFY